MTALSCVWCGRAFDPRTNGSHAQRFCRPGCRRAYDAAGRRWVAKAIADGALTLDELRNGFAATRALTSGDSSPAADASTIHGYFDGVDGSLADGWVADLSAPNRILDVELIAVDPDGWLTAVLATRADRLRDDLRAAGFGDGRHGFEREGL